MTRPARAARPEEVGKASPVTSAQPLPEIRLPGLRVSPEHPDWKSLRGFLTAGLARDVLPQVLPRRRWFGDKEAAAGAYRFQPTGTVQLPDETLILGGSVEIVGGERPHRYFLPLALGPDPGGEVPGFGLCRLIIGDRPWILADACGSDTFLRFLVSSIHGQRSVRLAPWPCAKRTFGAALRGGEGEALPTSCRSGPAIWQGCATSALTALPGSGGVCNVRIQRPTLEQSNTSVIVDGEWMLKVFRRQSGGINPEWEIGRHVTAAGAPPFLVATGGAVEVRLGAAEADTLAILQRLVPNDGDGWTWTLDRLRREVVANPPPESPTHGWMEWFTTLGRRTGQLHALLGGPSQDPAFRPRPIEQDDLDLWAGAGERQIGEAMARLERKLTGLPAEAQDTARHVLAAAPKLMAEVRTLPALACDGQKTRHHGDFHLGQVLVRGDDAVLIDFEGEPGRSLAERRALHSPLRDVAGMVRSFDYAVATILQETPAADRALVAACLRAWQDRAVAGFFRGYADGTGHGTAPGLTTDPLLRFFLVEKACYELIYELENRPAWVTIPLQGLAGLVSPP